MSAGATAAVRAPDLGHIHWRANVLNQCERVPMGGGTVLKVMDARFNELVCEQLQLMHGMKARRKRFPGCQPVSLMRQQLPFLLNGDYWISPKPDGTRYMLAMLQLHTQCDLPLADDAEEEKKDDVAANDPNAFLDRLLENKPQLDVVHQLVCFMDRACQVRGNTR
jgi:hypothetical protein